MQTFYKNPNSYRAARWMTLLGAGMVILSPFFHWIELSVKMNQDKLHDGKSLFGIMLEGFRYLRYGFASYKIAPLFLFLGVFILGLCMMYLGLRDTIWRKETLLPKALQMSRLDGFLSDYDYLGRVPKIMIHILPVVLCTIFFVLVKKTVMYKEIWTDFHNIFVTWKDMILMLRASRGVKTGSFRLGSGFGVFLLFAGQVLFLLSYAFRYVLDTLNEDDFQLGKAD